MTKSFPKVQKKNYISYVFLKAKQNFSNTNYEASQDLRKILQGNQKTNNLSIKERIKKH